MASVKPGEKRLLMEVEEFLRRNRINSVFAWFMAGCIILVFIYTLFWALPQVNAQMVESIANADRNAEQKNYFGVVTETDMGMGVFALSWKSASYTNIPEEKEWAGMLAEFRRRHTDLDIISSFPAGYSGHQVTGVTVITTPKLK